MLDALRGQKAKKFTAWILVILVGIPFIFYFGWSPSQGRSGGSSPLAAEVNGQPVNWYQIPRLRIEMAMSLLGPQALAPGAQDLVNRLFPDDVVVDEAIRSELLAQAAENADLGMTDPEVEGVIRSFVLSRMGVPPTVSVPAEQLNAAFSELADRVYGYPPQLLEQHILRRELRERATRVLIYPQARTSILELWQSYEEANTEYRLSCAVFRVSDHIASDEITEADIEEFYEANQDQFTDPPSRIYASVAMRQSDQRTHVTDEQVSAEYQENLSDYTESDATYELSQIVFAAEGDEMPEAVANMAALLASGEDFGELAREHSIDDATRTAGDGGWLGLRTLDMLQDPIAEAVVTLRPGEISEPILSGGHWFIIRLESARQAEIRPFDEVRDEIRTTLEARETRRIFDEYEADFLQVFDEFTRLEDMANALNLEVQVSDPVDVDATYIPGLGSIDQRRDEFRRLEVGQLLPEVFLTPDTIAIVQLQEERQQTTRPLDDELREIIRPRLAQIRAQERMETAAYTLREELIQRMAESPDEDPLAAEADEELPYQILETEPFKPLDNNIDQVGVVPGLARALYYSRIGTVSDVMGIRQPSGNRNAGYVVYIMRERITPERSDFYQALPALRAQVLRENQDRLINEWIADMRRPEVSEIVRYQLDER